MTRDVGLYLVTPHRPAGAGAAGEQFKPWPRTHRLDQRERLFRLLAVPWRVARREQVWTEPTKREPAPLAVSEEDRLRSVREPAPEAGRFHPVDRREIAEPPRPKDGETVLQKGVGRPQPEVGVRLRHAAHRKPLDLVHAHCRIRQSLRPFRSTLP